MLHEFITGNHDELVSVAMARMGKRPSPLVQPVDLRHGAGMFLEQLAETLRLRGSEAPFACDAIGLSAAKHGSELLNAGFNLSQVVHDYGDICQAVTQLALADIFQAFGDRRGLDRSGLGLGLSIARKAIRAQGGDITHRNLPGQGCVFVVQIPLYIETPGA